MKSDSALTDLLAIAQKTVDRQHDADREAIEATEHLKMVLQKQKELERDKNSVLAALRSYMVAAGYISEADVSVFSDFDTIKKYVNGLPLKRAVSSALKSLRPTEERVVRQRYGIGERSELAARYVYTQQHIADVVGVSQSTVSVVLRRAIRKLKHPSRSRRLRSFHGTILRTGFSQEEHLLLDIFGNPDNWAATGSA
jgi:RNA polymerase sigma factor (sigma-70 family)